MISKYEFLIEFFLFVLGVMFFLFLSLPFLGFPPLNNDELFISVLSSNIIKFNPVSLLYDFKCYILNDHNVFFPVLMNAYVGAIRAYLYYPFLLLGGVNEYAFRIGSIFYSIILLVIIYLWVKNWFGKKAAMLNHFLLSTNIVFVQFSRMSAVREEIYQLLFLFTIFIFIYNFYISNKKRYLYISFFVLGIGLSAKVMFLWFIFACSVSTLFFKKGRSFIKRIFEIRFYEFLLLLSSFCLGFFPYLYALSVSNGKFLVDFFLKSQTVEEVTISNLIFHFAKLFKLLIADFVSNQNTLFFVFNNAPKDFYIIFLLFVVMVGVVWLKINDRKVNGFKDVFTSKLNWCFLVVLVLICINFTNLDKLNLGYHFIVFPFIFCFISVFFSYFISKVRLQFKIGLYLILFIYLLLNIKSNLEFKKFFEHSLSKKNSIYKSTDLINQINFYKDKRPIILYDKYDMDLWNFEQLILVNSRFKLVPKMMFIDEVFNEDKYQGYIGDNGHLFFIKDNEVIRDNLKYFCLKNNLTVNFLESFDDGVKRFILLRVIKQNN